MLEEDIIKDKQPEESKKILEQEQIQENYNFLDNFEKDIDQRQ